MEPKPADFITEAKYDESTCTITINKELNEPGAGILVEFPLPLPSPEWLHDCGRFVVAAVNEKIQREKGECSWCEGKGSYINEEHPKYPDKQQRLDCKYCEGTGKALNTKK